MINWEELKHIHVIRKLEEVLAQWFHAEVFFVDERGNVRNYDPLDRQREFKNPLAATLLPKEKGRALVMQAIAAANEKALGSDKPRMHVEGPTCVEHAVVSRITVGTEFLGSVYAYCYLEKPATDATKSKGKARVSEAGLYLNMIYLVQIFCFSIGLFRLILLIRF